MSKNPKIKLRLNGIDKMLEFIGWVLLICLWLLVSLNYHSLPESIPLHYDLFGEADRFGNKKGVFLIPITATVLFLGMSLLNRIPHTFNYLTPITQSNAKKQYTLATRMVRCLKIAMVSIFNYLLLKTIFNALGTKFTLGLLFLPLLVTSFIVMAIYFIFIFLKVDQ